ncbi:MAG TPA: hypothetical protein VGH28_33815 [Polyangiaceae bacterium]|jgi:hypothetical protein
MRSLLLVAALAACSSNPDVPTPDGGSPPGDAAGPTSDGGATEAGEAGPTNDAGTGAGLSAKYPGDVGIASDPSVIWAELFDEGTVGAFTARYDSAANPPGMTLVQDLPAKSKSPASIRLTASGDGANATDFYKRFSTGYDEWYVRWYVKYDASIAWHHTGVWFGGYNPPTPYPNPQAGLKPNGDDRFSVAMEPVWNVGTASAQFDFYNYWMGMHSWMAQPSGSTAYYGNALVNQTKFSLDETKWVCVEVHVKLNSDAASAKDGVLEVWKNDALVSSFTGSGPDGYWIRDKFCTPSADGSECTDYPAPFNTVLDLQWRSTLALQLNYFWPQNYVTDSGVTGNVGYADMVIAKERVGCIQ